MQSVEIKGIDNNDFDIWLPLWKGLLVSDDARGSGIGCALIEHRRSRDAVC